MILVPVSRMQNAKPANVSLFYHVFKKANLKNEKILYSPFFQIQFRKVHGVASGQKESFLLPPG
jgi:hypothetical protein